MKQNKNAIAGFIEALKENDAPTLIKHDKNTGISVIGFQRVIVFIMGSVEIHCNVEDWRKIYRILFEALSDYPEYRLIIKWKGGVPGENLVHQIAKEFDYKDYQIVKNKLFKKVDSKKLLSNSDIVIIVDSTMYLDTMLLGKPVISIYPDFLNQEIRIKKSVPIKCVVNAKELKKELGKQLKLILLKI